MAVGVGENWGLVARNERNKVKFYVIVGAPSDGEWEVVDAYGERTVLHQSTVLSYHPPATEEGTSYGAKVQFRMRTGSIIRKDDLVCYDPSVTDSEFTAIVSSLRGTLGKVRQVGYGPVKDINFTIRQAKGSMVGSYSASKSDDTPDELMVSRAVLGEEEDISVAHEFGHMVWFQHLTKADHIKWLALYNRATKVNEYTTARIRSMCDDLLSAGSPNVLKKEYMDNGSVEDVKTLGQVLRFFRD